MIKKYNKKQIILSSLVLGSLIGISAITTSCSLSSNLKNGEIPLAKNYKKLNNNSNLLVNNISDIKINDSLDLSNYSKTSLVKLENFYPNQHIEEFKENNFNEEKIKEIIFDHNIASNYYSHPKFKLEKKYLTLDNENKTEKLKLIDSKTNQEIQDVKWYQRLRFPTDKLLKADQDDNDSLVKLKADGTISAKQYKKSSDAQVVEIWAEYKGNLYKSVVTILPIVEVNILKAKQEAKKIVEQQGWKDLHVLEQITKAYDWMTKEVKFDYNVANSYDNQTAYSALVNKKTVCTGYAKGFQMLMDELGILSTLITSDVSPRDLSGVKHVWNLVEIDGEWYHLDATSDRIEGSHQKQEYRFFLLHDDDFTKNDVFLRNTREFGQRFRNLKLTNFVKNKEDIDVLIDKEFSDTSNKNKVLKINTHSNLYSTISDSFTKSNLELLKYTISKTNAFSSYKTINYMLKDNKSETKDIQVQKIEKYVEKDKSKTLGHYAIKINLSEKVDGLKPGNFNIENAMIKELKQEDNSYILYLDHFKNFNKVTVKINDIKKRGYKFNLSNNIVTFDVQKFKEIPQAIVKAIDEKEVLINNVKPGMQYRNNINRWIDITSESFIANNIVFGKLQFRWKDSYDKFASDVQTVEISKAIDVYNMIKVQTNTITGVDDTMEYRVINKNSQWENIISNKLENLKPGTYEIRTKANDKELASNSHQVNIN
ncbi:putative liporotein [synthetic Mycoplasma mycoides JCVI-syn1.0]|uniref:MAG6410 family transglutaminase-related lipoprotein n=1 Tax=Mycoplasma mycoides TaxID=2102 RepID=UPI0001793E86|nr:transglutaminase domain-containing protein [Mycoplasma mycoides]ADH22262.1 putative liporotein [synthetic Mycoplasma mycoides JCVI-syn1.0]ACU78965.1 putative liporotein [Mycoplasma mycoides subsp. capri str. GM12]ACU79796.1 putative liporotein [Mycoplasma mycoides subsp. capri str. GM12]SRX58452.1 putative lipoprotein [Mycoplasma mycoides subsp. capri]SRX60966.1 putative lipoprotein [Mycoplasma mycoides subsp. capri]